MPGKSHYLDIRVHNRLHSTLHNALWRIPDTHATVRENEKLKFNNTFNYHSLRFTANSNKVKMTWTNNVNKNYLRIVNFLQEWMSLTKTIDYVIFMRSHQNNSLKKKTRKQQKTSCQNTYIGYISFTFQQTNNVHTTSF